MAPKQTKSFKRKEVSSPLLIGIFGLFVVVMMHLTGLFNFADSAEGPISDSDKVSVDGVANTTQYLTSLVLHSPESNKEKIILKYDPDLNALRIQGTVNADGLIIGDGDASSGSAIFGGKENKAFSEVRNGLIVGGAKNEIKSSTGSIIIGGDRNIVQKANNVTLVGSSETKFRGDIQKEQVVVLGANDTTIHGSHIFVLGGAGNEAGSDSVLMGKRIKAGEVEKVFVWSDKEGDFTPAKSSAFYINTTNGVGINTNDPKVMVDFGAAGGGALKLATSSSVKHCNAELKGVMAYVHAGGKSGFCGCNGEKWVPLTADPTLQAVCVNREKKDCTGGSENTNVRGYPNPGALPRRDLGANGGDGDWIPVPWTYGGIKNSEGQIDCAYLCKIGYHPGVDHPSGRQTGGCKDCTSFDNRYTEGSNAGWRTAGTGNNNCDFGCNGGYAYTNTFSKRSCKECEIGKWTPVNNQQGSCSLCEKPAHLYVDLQGASPHYAKFTTTGASEAGCQFECSPRYAHFFNGKKYSGASPAQVIPGVGGTIVPDGNACIHCPKGTYSAGGQEKTCKACTPVSNMKKWLTNGATNGTTKEDCDFTCKGGYAYKNTGPSRSCSACAIGKYTDDDKQETSCTPCTNKPANSSYSGPGNGNACPRQCNSGYRRSGDICINTCQTPWRTSVTHGTSVTAYNSSSVFCPNGFCQEKTLTCNGETGLFGTSGFGSYTHYNCTEEDNSENRSITNGSCTKYCSAGSTTWGSESCSCNAGYTYDGGSCDANDLCGTNAKSYEGSETQYPSPNAFCDNQASTNPATPAFPGGGAEVSWTCTLGANTKTCSASRGSLQAGACGDADKTPTKVKPTTDLCASGNTPSSVDENASDRTWSCTSKDGVARPCSARKAQLQPGVCENSFHNSLLNSLKGDESLCSYLGLKAAPNSFETTSTGWEWKCEGDSGTTPTSCFAKKRSASDGKCGSSLNECETTYGSSESKRIDNGNTWKCLGSQESEPRGTDVLCGTCDSGYTAKKEVNNGRTVSVTCMPNIKNTSCGGVKPTEPTGGYFFGNDEYQQNLNISTWTYDPMFSRTNTNKNPNQLGACEYTCNTANGYTLHNGLCAKSETYHWECSTSSTIGESCHDVTKDECQLTILSNCWIKDGHGVLQFNWYNNQCKSCRHLLNDLPPSCNPSINPDGTTSAIPDYCQAGEDVSCGGFSEKNACLNGWNCNWGPNNSASIPVCKNSGNDTVKDSYCDKKPKPMCTTPTQTRAQNCPAKPANTEWNTISSYTQTSTDGGANWAPIKTATYNETASTTECRYKCTSDYEWDGSSCVMKNGGDIGGNPDSNYYRTERFDFHTPRGVGPGAERGDEMETISMIHEHGKSICASPNIKDIECRAVSYLDMPLSSVESDPTKCMRTCDKYSGYIGRATGAASRCFDVRIRFLCQ